MMAIPYGCAFTVSANNVLKSKLTDFITINAIMLAPSISNAALIIYTQVVASMLPNNTYSTMRRLYRTTAT